MIKFTILLRRLSGLSHEDFVQYHKFQHAPLFKSIPQVQNHVRGYIQCHVQPVDIPGFPPPLYDGTTELWFDDIQSIGKVFSDPQYLEVIRPDEMKFLDLNGCSFLLTIENKVI